MKAQTGPGQSWLAGGWTVDALAKMSASALDALEAQMEKGSMLRNIDVTLAKIRGPILVHGKEAWLHLPEPEPDGSMALDMRSYTELPAMALIGLEHTHNASESEMEEIVRHKRQLWSFDYAQRLAELPEGVVPTGPGYAYKYSVWLHYHDTREDLAMSGHATVDPITERVYPCRYVTDTEFEIRHRQRGRCQRGTRKRTRFSTHGSIPCPLFTHKLFNDGGESKQTMLSALVMTLELEMQRDHHWQMEVSRYTELFQDHPLRAVATIHPEEAKRLFSTRDKVEHVLTAAGKRRPILHWARSHYRNQYAKPTRWWHPLLWRVFPKLRPIVGTGTVRTHLRGLTEFALHGISCRLGVPGKHLPMMNTGLNMMEITDPGIRSGYDPDATGDAALEQLVNDKGVPAALLRLAQRPRFYRPLVSRHE